MGRLIPDNLKSRADVPSAIRRCASALEMALDDSATIWYEPLFDPAGTRPHLVVLMPERGICLLEVADAKSSTFLMFKGKPSYTVDGVVVANPILRAQKLAESLTARISENSLLNPLGLKVGYASCLINVTSKEAREIGVLKEIAAENSLYKDEIEAAISGNGEAAMMRAFTRIIGPMLLDEISPNVEKTLRGIIQPDIVISSPAFKAPDQKLAIFSIDNAEVVKVMDRQQEAMAKSLGDGHRVIRGVAGSGKTLILVFRAKLIAQISPEKKILVTCFTQTLAAQLRVLLKEYVNIEVSHLHSLKKDVIADAKLMMPVGDNKWDEITELALQGVGTGAGPRYDLILVDEAQDLTSDELRFVVGLLKEGADDLVIVADAAQNIYKRKFNWRQAGIKAQGRTRILRTNYRNTNEILNLANKFLLAGKEVKVDDLADLEDEHSVISPESSKRTGPKPEVQFVATTLLEIKTATAKLLEWITALPQDQKIAVLYPGTDGMNRGEMLARHWKHVGLDFYNANERFNYGAKSGLATAKQRVILSTVYGAKGLEFPNVILCGLTQAKNDVEANRKLSYVGMTRATEKLYVIAKIGTELSDDLRKAVDALDFVHPS